MKSVNACSSYRGFSEVTPKTKVSTICNCTDIWPSKCMSVQISNITKVCVQNVLVCSNASWKTWTSLPDRFIDEHLVEMFPLLDQRDFSWSTSWIRLRYTRYCSFPQIWLAGKFCDEFFAPYPFSCLSTIIKTRSSAEIPCLLSKLTVYKWQVTAVSNAVLETEIFCHRYLNINNSAIK